MEKEARQANQISEINLVDRLSERYNRHDRELRKAYDQIAEIEKRLEEIDDEKHTLLEQLHRLEMTVKILEPILAEEQEDFTNLKKGGWDAIQGLGIQEYCRRAVYDTKGPIDAAGIRDALTSHGIKLEYANPLAVIHTCLKRLSEDIRSFRQQEENGNGKKVWVRYYEWTGPRASSPK